jgi:hypothetical protein
MVGDHLTRTEVGSLLRAQGGYLIFSLEDALTEPAVWKMYHVGVAD